MAQLHLCLFLITIFTIFCGVDTLPLNYIVGCSACYTSPVKDVESYSCRVKCDNQGKLHLAIRVSYI